MRLAVLLLIAVCSAQKVVWYFLPKPKLLALSPKGYIISIPDDGFSYITFYGKLNKEMDRLREADWIQNITTMTTDGMWVYRDTDLKLAVGDKMYYRTYFTKDKIEYRDYGLKIITELVDATLLPTIMYKPIVNLQTSVIETQPSSTDGAQTSEYSTRRSAYVVRLPPTYFTTSAYEVRPPPVESSDSGYEVRPPPVDFSTSAYEVRPPPVDSSTSSYVVRPPPVSYITSANEVQPPSSDSTTSAYEVRLPPVDSSTSTYEVQPPLSNFNNASYEVKPSLIDYSTSVNEPLMHPIDTATSTYKVRPHSDDSTTSANKVEPTTIDLSPSDFKVTPAKSDVSSYEANIPKAYTTLPNSGEEYANTSILPTKLIRYVTAMANSTFKIKSSYRIQTSTHKSTKLKCEISMTIVQGQGAVCGGSLIFSEEFNNTTSVGNLSSWDAERKFPGEPDYPFNVYAPEHTIKFQSGSLVITPVLTENIYGQRYVKNGELNLNDRCTGKVNTWECIRKANKTSILPPVMTGKITTKHKFAFKYGRVEIRAKLPAGDWLIPELILEPSENVYGKFSYESGLMRIAFARGNTIFAKRLYGGAVLSNEEPYRSLHLKEAIGIDGWNEVYHNYTMVWRPDSLHLFVDGKQYGLVYPGEGFHASAREYAVPHASSWLNGNTMAPLDQMFYISLGLRVGGVNDFTYDTSVLKPWKNRGRRAMLSFWAARNSWLPTWHDADLKIDYIRVYAI